MRSIVVLLILAPAFALAQVSSVRITSATGATVATVDANGVEIQGAGVAGTPAGGVVSIQGVASGTTVPVSGTVTITDGAGAVNVIIDSGTTAVTQATASSLNAEVQGDTAHDVTATGNPVRIGGTSSATAPADVTADGEAVNAWHLRNGAAATVLTAAGALIGGDATNGIDVDVTRLPALVAGTANIGDVDILTIAAGDTNIGNVDIVTLPDEGQQTMAASISVTIASNQSSVPVTVGAPTDPLRVECENSATVAGAAVDCDTAQIASGQTAKLEGMTITGYEGSLSCVLQTVLNGVATDRAHFAVSGANPTVLWNTPHKDYVAQAESVTAGLDAFRVSCTNREPTGGNTVSAKVALFYDEA